MDRIDTAVIGAGVVGLAVARAMAMRGRSVVILERERRFGTVTSSRNSEVIHAGLYYPPGSLKERLCVEGRKKLYAFCEAHHVPHSKCGKLILAAEEAELPALEAIAARAAGAGIHDMAWLDPAGVAALEPQTRCVRALLSPSTGIIDSHAYMLALLGEAEDHGAMIAYGVDVHSIACAPDGWTIGTADTTFHASTLVNAAGLGAQGLAALISDLAPQHIPPLHLAKGSYFAYSGRVPFRHLIYPVPVPGSLGTHLALDLAGQARFGPDIEWVDSIDYDVDPARKPDFVAAARKIWPSIDPARLHPAYAGIRPKLSGPGEPAADFVIQGPEAHGLVGLINLFGIESPGLTASLAIADHVAAMVGG